MVFLLGNELFFPHPSLADSSGLLAIGGDLNPQRLILAYRFGIFPWYSEGEPLMWWCTQPRFVLFPQELHIPKSMRSLLRKDVFKVTENLAFEQVIRQCSKVPRPNQEGTWISPEMIDAYITLHKMGIAVSVETWKDEELVGGLYGIRIGKVFYGESMFALTPDASKFAFIRFVQRLAADGFMLIDCQMETDHMKRFGGRNIDLESFLDILQRNWKYEV